MVVRLQRRSVLPLKIAITVVAGIAGGGLLALATAGSAPAVHADVLPTTAALVAPQSSPVGTTVAEQTSKKHGMIHGLASWYGGVFNGRTTASGEKFDMHELTACHPTLPFGSLVRVINRRNKKSVVVRINDRGDLINDRRVIDLSWAAAEKLAMTRAGVVRVDLEVLSLGGPQPGN